MLIYGAGGHGRVVLSILAASGVQVAGVFDDSGIDRAIPGHEILGVYCAKSFPGQRIIIGIGNNQDRKKVVTRVAHPFGKAIHPTALVDDSVKAGLGIVIVHNAVVQAGCCLGNHVIINTAAVIDHECMLGNFVHIGPGATLCGGVRVGECTLVGAGSVVLPQVSIGRECVIGAGSVVTRNVPDYAKMAGNPARIIH
nr:acetyltransferase [uncultured Dyadobacter sp.]